MGEGLLALNRNSLTKGRGSGYYAATMAKSGENDGGTVGGWPGFLSELTKSFLILRDVFGYALPGAVFLGIGLVGRQPHLRAIVAAVAKDYSLPEWVWAAIALGACYTVGHVMAQVAYLPFNWKKWREKQSAKAKAKTTKTKGGAQVEETAEHWGLDPVLITLRDSHPAMLTELERQSTMSQLRGGAGAAMLLGYLVFCTVCMPLAALAGIAGAFQLMMFWFSGQPHIEDLSRDTIKAGKELSVTDKPAPEGPR